MWFMCGAGSVDVLTNLTTVIILQCMPIWRHYIIHLKFTLAKAGEKGWKVLVPNWGTLSKKRTRYSPSQSLSYQVNSFPLVEQGQWLELPCCNAVTRKEAHLPLCPWLWYIQWPDAQAWHTVTRAPPFYLVRGRRRILWGGGEQLSERNWVSFIFRAISISCYSYALSIFTFLI